MERAGVDRAGSAVWFWEQGKQVGLKRPERLMQEIDLPDLLFCKLSPDGEPVFALV
jgi:hypothetical protein